MIALIAADMDNQAPVQRDNGHDETTLSSIPATLVVVPPPCEYMIALYIVRLEVLMRSSDKRLGGAVGRVSHFPASIEWTNLTFVQPPYTWSPVVQSLPWQ